MTGLVKFNRDLFVGINVLLVRGDDNIYERAFSFDSVFVTRMCACLPLNSPLKCCRQRVCLSRVTAIFEKGVKLLKRYRNQNLCLSFSGHTFEMLFDIPEAGLCAFCYLV